MSDMNVLSDVNATRVVSSASTLRYVDATSDMSVDTADIEHTAFVSEKTAFETKIYRVSIDGRSTQIYPRAGAERSERETKKPTQLEIMVRHIIKTSESDGISPLDAPWTEPLVESLCYNELPRQWRVKPAGDVLSAVAGVIDDPRGQRKTALKFDFAAEGGLLVFGASGSGKTTLLKTICLSLAARYTPDEVNIYLLDMSGSTLKAFCRLPHSGGVLTIDMERDIRQFLLFLFRILENRKRIFEEANAESYTDYRKAGYEMPSVVVMIDSYAPLAEVYEDIDERLVVLSRDSFRYGIYLIITATNARDIRYRLSTNFKMALTFELIDKSYSDIVGRTEGLEPESFCGRGLVKLEKPLEFQAALPLNIKNGVIIQTKEIIEDLLAKETRRAAPIPVMPSRVDFRCLNAEFKDFRIGLNDSDLSPVQLNLVEYSSFLIAGAPGCGKSTVASHWLTALKDARIYALDSAGAGLALIFEHENIRDLSAMDLDSFICEFDEELDSRRSALAKARKSGRDISSAANSMAQVIFAFDKFSEAADDDVYYDLMKLMARIVKKAHGLKVMVLAIDTVDGFNDDYSDAGKAIKAEQTGLLLGSIKEQSLFNVSLPYNTPEKEISFGDGYLIKKSKFWGLRVAL
jgi:S-DNA-T family DNA segregation ATPase FtsK/SpoIIIE